MIRVTVKPTGSEEGVHWVVRNTETGDREHGYVWDFNTFLPTEKRMRRKALRRARAAAKRLARASRGEDSFVYDEKRNRLVADVADIERSVGIKPLE